MTQNKIATRFVACPDNRIDCSNPRKGPRMLLPAY